MARLYAPSVTGEKSDTIAAWIERWAGGDKIAFVFEGNVTTYSQFHDRIGSAAAALSASGVEPGDRIAFCGLNRVELFELLFACAHLGAIFLPLNNRLTVTELREQIDDCEPALLFTTDGFNGHIGKAGRRSVRDLDADPFPAAAPPLAAGSMSSPSLMVYTSGTTGRPKGAVLTQDAIAHTVLNSIDHQALSGDDRIIAPLPTFHVGGLNIQTLPALFVGAEVLLQRRFDPGGVLDLIARHRPTQTLLVPAMLQAVADHPAFAETDLSCLDGINTGSSIVPPAVMQPFFDRGIPVGQVYGATETGPTAVVLAYREAADHMASCGRPSTHTELRIADADGRDVLPGTDGELLVRGPHIFSGYWNNPAATAEAFIDGWYRTGDIGHQDADGYVFVSDRVNDTIISGGENVYPAEVEIALDAHPDIAEITVVGRPDPTWGETVVAVVVLCEGSSLTLEELRSWLGDRLARFKHPRVLVRTDRLPRTALGKVQKHVVRTQLGLD
jgi:fatty-acyl-CoA synthase